MVPQKSLTFYFQGVWRGELGQKAYFQRLLLLSSGRVRNLPPENSRCGYVKFHQVVRTQKKQPQSLQKKYFIACCFLGNENEPNINIMDPNGQIFAYMQAWIIPYQIILFQYLGNNCYSTLWRSTQIPWLLQIAFFFGVPYNPQN